MKTACFLYCVAVMAAPAYSAAGTNVVPATPAGATPGNLAQIPNTIIVQPNPGLETPPGADLIAPIPQKTTGLLIQELDGMNVRPNGPRGLATPADRVHLKGGLRQLPGGYLGLLLGAAPVDREAIKTATPAGASVEDVVRDGPAARAGIQPGDIITALSGKQVTTPERFAAILHAFPPGKKLVLGVVRQTHRITVGVALGAPPLLLRDADDVPPGAVAQPPPSVHAVKFIHGGVYVSGRVMAQNAPVPDANISAYDASGADTSALAVTNALANGCYVLHLPGPGAYRLIISGGRGSITKDLQVPPGGLQKADFEIPPPERITTYLAPPPVQRWAYLGLVLRDPQPDSGLLAPQGAAVEEVAPGSPGAAAGIQAADVVIAMDGHIVTGPVDLTAFVRKSPIGKKVIVHIHRGAQALDLPAVLGQVVLAPAEAPRATILELEGVQRLDRLDEIGDP